MAQDARIAIPMFGRFDKNEKDYYFAIPHLPVTVDLSKVVFLIYPWESNKNEETFGAELVIKKLDDRSSSKDFKDER